MAVATTFSDMMAQLTGNTGGAVQSLPPSYQVYGRRRGFIASIALAAQAAASVIGVARLPVPCVPTDITLLTDTSLGTATIALGDTNAAALFMAAQTLTAVDTPTKVGKTAALGVPLAQGYDCVSGNLTTYKNAGSGGGGYEDMILTTAVAALPGAGNLRILVEFMID